MRAMYALTAIVMTAGLAAQEGTATLPQNYKLQFENAWVKVTAVRYGPNEKLPEHTHTPHPAAYVYLNDGGPVIFRHVGGPAATRAATKAGAFRVYKGLDEVHEVENTTSVPSEFLRVELKTEGRDPATFRGKFMRPSEPANDAVVQFDHPQVRVSRVWLKPGERLKVTTAAEPALVIALSATDRFRAGREWWVGPSSSVEVRNGDGSPIDFLRFDLKTLPVNASR